MEFFAFFILILQKMQHCFTVGGGQAVWGTSATILLRMLFDLSDSSDSRIFIIFTPVNWANQEVNLI